MLSRLQRMCSAGNLTLASVFCTAIGLGLFPTMVDAAPRGGFQLEEATIADVHRAILARQLTVTQLVNAYLKRIETYGGTCVKGPVDPATGFQLGDIEPIEHAGKLNAIITINVRGKRSKTD